MDSNSLLELSITSAVDCYYIAIGLSWLAAWRLCRLTCCIRICLQSSLRTCYIVVTSSVVVVVVDDDDVVDDDVWSAALTLPGPVCPGAMFACPAITNTPSPVVEFVDPPVLNMR